jgi:diguanylate cyclase (GGDEF)-like protein
VTAAAHHRRLLVLCGFLAYGVVFSVFVLFEVPGLGVGHFYYVAVALIALATRGRIGAVAGAAAAALYALGILISPRLPVTEILTVSTLIRLTTFMTIGLVIGRFASAHRSLVIRLEDLARRDHLTDIDNARAFDDALGRRCASGRPFVLVLADMDNLKDVNDAHGHAAGNVVLRRLADLLRAHAGSGDDLARVGGDEFALLTEIRVDEAAELCSRLQRTLEREGLDVSFGWAALPQDGTAAVQLFRKADDRLYTAKLLRRNRHAVLELAVVAQHE